MPARSARQSPGRYISGITLLPKSVMLLRRGRRNLSASSMPKREGTKLSESRVGGIRPNLAALSKEYRKVALVKVGWSPLALWHAVWPRSDDRSPYREWCVVRKHVDTDQ